MPELDHSERLDRSIDRFEKILHRLQSRQNHMEHRLANLYQTAAVALTAIVVSISLLVILLAYQAPGMTAAIGEMNQRFGAVADNMVRMDRTVTSMNEYMQSLPAVITHVDLMHTSVADMSSDIALLSGSFTSLDESIAEISDSVGDMRGSFEIMEHSVGRMRHDVNRMSQPMRWFNSMNPLY